MEFNKINIQKYLKNMEHDFLEVKKFKIRYLVDNILETGEKKEEIENIFSSFLDNIIETDNYEKIIFFNLEDSSKDFESITWIKLKANDFENDSILTFLREWKIEDFKEWWFLQKIFANISISNKLINEKNFDLKDLEEFFSYNLDYHLIKEHQKEIFSHSKWFYYWYFVEFNKDFENQLYYWYNIGDNFPVNYNNFVDFMEDDEVAIEFEQDEWLEFEWIKPWTKAWFEEKPERKRFLEKEKIRILKENWTILGLYKLEWMSEWMKNNKMDYFSKKLWLDINIKYYSFLISLGTEIDIFLKICQKIDWINEKNINLLIWYIEEHWISVKYFIKDLALLKTKIDIKILILLLKNKIYPTKNIINYMEEWWKIKKLLKMRENYKQKWEFDIDNDLHIDLEYIKFRYVIDTSSNKNSQVWKWYNEYKELIWWNYDEKLDNEKEYKQAWYESYIAYDFIEKIKEQNNFVNVFSNLSYWKVITWAFKGKLEKDEKINFKETRIWSTECQRRLSYIKKDLFSKEDIKKLFLWDSIILDWTNSYSFPSSNIWYKSYFYILNKILSDLLKDDKFINWYDNIFIKNIELNKDYNQLYFYLKWIIFKNWFLKNAKPFNFIYASQNENMSLRIWYSNEKKLKNINILNNETIKIYYSDFVDREPEFWTQAYFDDKHITNFKIIPTKNWFNFTDLNFENELKKHFLKFTKKKKINVNIKYYSE